MFFQCCLSLIVNYSWGQFAVRYRSKYSGYASCFDSLLGNPYYCAPMLTTRLPTQVEPYRLAANAERLEGVISLSEMTRLGDEIGKQRGDSEVCLDFGIDEQGRRYIEGWLKAKVLLACRRCLKPLPFVLESHFLLGVVASDALAAELPSNYEPVVVGNEQLNLQEMLEDELILSLPQVVYHDEAECAVSRDQLVSGTNPDVSDETAASPFDVLRTLKNKH